MRFVYSVLGSIWPPCRPQEDYQKLYPDWTCFVPLHSDSVLDESEDEMGSGKDCPVFEVLGSRGPVPIQ